MYRAVIIKCACKIAVSVALLSTLLSCTPPCGRRSYCWTEKHLCLGLSSSSVFICDSESGQLLLFWKESGFVSKTAARSVCMSPGWADVLSSYVSSVQDILHHVGEELCSWNFPVVFSSDCEKFFNDLLMEVQEVHIYHFIGNCYCTIIYFHCPGCVYIWGDVTWQTQLLLFVLSCFFLFVQSLLSCGWWWLLNWCRYHCRTSPADLWNLLVLLWRLLCSLN